MKILSSLNKDSFLLISWTILFMFFTINDSTTNLLHRELNSTIIPALLFLFVGFFLVGISTFRKIDNSLINRLLLMILLLSLGLFVSAIYGGMIFFLNDQMLLVYLFISLVFYFLTSWLLSQNIEMNLNLYFFLILFLSILTGGLSFTPLPYIDLTLGQDIYRNYSQGITGIFGLFSIYFLNKYFKEKRNLIVLALAAFSLLISIFGGSRGELVAVILCLAIVGFNYRLKTTFFLTIPTIIISLILFVDFNELQNTLVVVQRFMVLGENNFGLRDVLFNDSINMILSTSCGITGCGFNYFQIYNNYEFGLYPHNAIFELIITFGLLGVIISILSLIGFFRACTLIKQNNIYIMIIFYYLILMKSGSLMSFTAFTVVLVLMHQGLEFIKSNVIMKKNKRPE